ncbi:uncharacterized protein LOC115926067 [Strongylocentrotus purpuratus]|uniref:Uncharacterized protein n=1 Tax=Strongylocentrotus purpuratus TaxID=7668 RepID=A0A7M7P553_STRPU|nr:uncharacterized protein LOC115926067 [Strongylocentrotus purpuratus]
MARRYYSLTQMEQEKCRALVDDYLSGSRIEFEGVLLELIYFFSVKRCWTPRRYEQESALLVIEVCTIMEDHIRYIWNNFQNSDQVHVPEALRGLLRAGAMGCMTVPKFQDELQLIHSGKTSIIYM